MTVVWLNGTVGSGKSTVGQALAAMLPGAGFLDGDDLAGPSTLPMVRRWRIAHATLLRHVSRARQPPILVIAYPLQQSGYDQLRAACGRASCRLVVVTLATPLATTLRGRGGRQLSPAEQARVRQMRSEGYQARRFAAFSLPNASSPTARTARLIACRVHRCCHERPCRTAG